MEKTVAEVFRAVEERWVEHKDEHPDCPQMREDAFPMSDSVRADFLGLVVDAAKRGLLSPEDEMDLEIAIGTYGDNEHFGWPETTTVAQRMGVLYVLANLMHELNTDTSSVMDDFSNAIRSLRDPEYAESDVDIEVIAVDGQGQTHELPSGLVELLQALAGRKSGSQQPQPAKESDDDTDWFTRGYL